MMTTTEVFVNFYLIATVFFNF